MTIRKFVSGDAQPLSALIRRTIREVNGKDYNQAETHDILAQYTSRYVTSIAAEGSLYVALDEDGSYLGCGAITPHDHNPGEAYVLAVFIHPDHLGRGLGKSIMKAIEADPIFRRAARVELHSSLTAHGFYHKLGYAYTSGEAVPEVGHYNNGCYQMEKPGGAAK